MFVQPMREIIMPTSIKKNTYEWWVRSRSPSVSGYILSTRERHRAAQCSTRRVNMLHLPEKKYRRRIANMRTSLPSAMHFVVVQHREELSHVPRGDTGRRAHIMWRGGGRRRRTSESPHDDTLRGNVNATRALFILMGPGFKSDRRFHLRLGGVG